MKYLRVILVLVAVAGGGFVGYKLGITKDLDSAIAGLIVGMFVGAIAGPLLGMLVTDAYNYSDNDKKNCTGK